MGRPIRIGVTVMLHYSDFSASGWEGLRDGAVLVPVQRESKREPMSVLNRTCDASVTRIRRKQGIHRAIRGNCHLQGPRPDDMEGNPRILREIPFAPS